MVVVLALFTDRFVKVVVNRRDDMKSFEFMNVDVLSYGNSMMLVIIYRPYPSKKNKHSYADVIVEYYAMMTTRFAIVGDFNIHWDVPSDNNVKRFADLLESLNIIQHVHAATHVDDHTIDLILTPSGNHGITSTKNNVAALRSPLGRMHRRHGETGRFTENNHAPKI